MKDITSLKLYISQIINEENEAKKDYIINTNLNTFNPLLSLKEKTIKKQKIESKSVKENTKKKRKIFPGSKNEFLNPPKKTKTKVRINSAEKRKEVEKLKLVDIISKHKKFGKMQKYHNIKNKRRPALKPIENPTKTFGFDVQSLKSDKARKRKSIIDYEKEKEIRQKLKEREKEKEKEKERIIFIEPSENKLIRKKMKEDKYGQTKSEIKRPQKNKEMEIDDNKNLDDYELNHLGYEQALTLDKRGFLKTYWSILKRDHLIIFTFFPWNDYNLFYVKIEKFFFVILTLMVMNGFLFADKSIHKLYLSGVKYDLSQRLLQIILSVIITHVMELILCFLSMTDRYIYEIKALPKERTSTDSVFIIMKRMRIRLVAFYVSIFFITIFYWYFISAFCAVYRNTQGIFLIDWVLSFILFIIDPFIVYALIALLRIIALKNILKKKIKCLYTLSRLFPRF